MVEARIRRSASQVSRRHLHLRVEELEPRITLNGDATPPFVVATVPVEGSQVAGMSQYDVTFSEPLDRMYFKAKLMTVDGVGAGTLHPLTTAVLFVSDETVRFTMLGQVGTGQFSINMAQGVVRDVAHNLSAPDSRSFTGAGGGLTAPANGAKQFTLPYRFQDDDGTWVSVSIKGPGTGFLTLTNNVVTWAQIDTIVVNGATSKTTLAIKTKGGALVGTSVKNIYVNETGGTGLKRLSAPRVDIADNGVVEICSSVKKMDLRDIGQNASINVQGSVDSFVIRGTEQDVTIGVTGDLGRFRSTRIGWGATISAGDAIGSFTASIGVMYDTVISAGAGGMGNFTVVGMSNSVVKSVGSIGNVKVQGNLESTSIAANIGPGPDGKYGTQDDVIINPSLTSAIRSLTVKGTFTGSGDPNDHYGVVANGTIGRPPLGGDVTVGGVKHLLPWLFGNVTVAQYWNP